DHQMGDERRGQGERRRVGRGRQRQIRPGCGGVYLAQGRSDGGCCCGRTEIQVRDAQMINKALKPAPTRRTEMNKNLSKLPRPNDVWHCPLWRRATTRLQWCKLSRVSYAQPQFPSPHGRGRIIASRLAKPSAQFLSRVGRYRSLSLRERVRVKGIRT